MSYYRTARDVIAKLVKNYEENAIRAALLQHWAKINEIPVAKLKQADSAAAFLEASNTTEVEHIRHKFDQSIFRLSIKTSKAFLKF